MAWTKCSRNSESRAGSGVVLRRGCGHAPAGGHGAAGGRSHGPLVVAGRRRLPRGPVDPALRSSHPLPRHLLDTSHHLSGVYAVATLRSGSHTYTHRTIRSRRFVTDDITDICS